MRALLFLSILILLSTFSSCIIIRDHSIGKTISTAGIANTPAISLGNNALDLEKALLSFPLTPVSNQGVSTLFVSAINEKEETIVSIHLEAENQDTLSFKAVLQDFKKTKNVIAYFSFSRNLLLNTIIEKNQSNYHLAIPRSKSLQYTTSYLYDLSIKNYGKDLLFLYEGRIVNDESTEVKFVLQTDPLPTITALSIVIVASYMSTSLSSFLDFCKFRMKQMEKECKPPKKMKTEIIMRPLIELGPFSFVDNVIKDCKVTCQ